MAFRVIFTVFCSFFLVVGSLCSATVFSKEPRVFVFAPIDIPGLLDADAFLDTVESAFKFVFLDSDVSFFGAKKLSSIIFGESSINDIIDNMDDVYVIDVFLEKNGTLNIGYQLINSKIYDNQRKRLLVSSVENINLDIDNVRVKSIRFAFFIYNLIYGESYRDISTFDDIILHADREELEWLEEIAVVSIEDSPKDLHDAIYSFLSLVRAKLSLYLAPYDRKKSVNLAYDALALAERSPEIENSVLGVAWSYVAMGRPIQHLGLKASEKSHLEILLRDALAQINPDPEQVHDLLDALASASGIHRTRLLHLGAAVKGRLYGPHFGIELIDSDCVECFVPEVLNVLAGLLIQKGDLQGAYDALHDAYEREPENFHIGRNLAWLLASLGRKGEAQKMWSSLIFHPAAEATFAREASHKEKIIAQNGLKR